MIDERDLDRGPADLSGGEVLPGYRNDSQRALVRAAIPLFRDRGYRGTSIEDIVGAAHLTKPTFYYYFPSKVSLLASILEASLARIDRILAEADGTDGSSVERLQRLVAAYTKEVCDRPALWTIYFAERDRLDPQVVGPMRERERQIVERFRRVLASGVDAGELKPIEPFVGAMAFVGMASWLHRWYRKAGRLGSSEISDVFGVLAEGLAAGPNQQAAGGGP